MMMIPGQQRNVFGGPAGLGDTLMQMVMNYFQGQKMKQAQSEEKVLAQIFGAKGPDGQPAPAGDIMQMIMQHPKLSKKSRSQGLQDLSTEMQLSQVIEGDNQRSAISDAFRQDPDKPPLSREGAVLRVMQNPNLTDESRKTALYAANLLPQSQGNAKVVMTNKKTGRKVNVPIGSKMMETLINSGEWERGQYDQIAAKNQPWGRGSEENSILSYYDKTGTQRFRKVLKSNEADVRNQIIAQGGTFDAPGKPKYVIREYVDQDGKRYAKRVKESEIESMDSMMAQKGMHPGGESQKGFFDQEKALRNEFNNLTKDFREVKAAYGTVKTNSGGKAVDDMALIFSIMKMYDPGSVVREGEFATAQNSRGVPDSIRNTYNKILSGVRLTPQQRQDFVASAERVYDMWSTQLEPIENAYKDISRHYGLDPNRVITDFRFADSKSNPVRKKYNPATGKIE